MIFVSRSIIKIFLNDKHLENIYIGKINTMLIPVIRTQLEIIYIIATLTRSPTNTDDIWRETQLPPLYY